MRLTGLLQQHHRRNPEKFRVRESGDDDCWASVQQKFPGAIFGSIALMLKIYGSSDAAAAAGANRPDNDKILIVDTVNKAFQTLKIVFARRVVQLPKDADGQQPQSASSSKCPSESSCWYYPSCISRYLQDCQQRVNRDSLCKLAMTTTSTSEPRLFVACRRKQQRDEDSRVEYSQQDLVDIASVLMKLKKHLKQRCHQRQQQHRPITAKCCCDKAVQCDYPREAARFFSKPQQQQQQQQPRRNSSSSLEYVAANYRRELPNDGGGDGKSFRSLSSSAIFAQQRGQLNYSRSPLQRRNRARRGLEPSPETLRRRRSEDDDEKHLCTASLHYNEKFRASSESTMQPDRSDVLAVRKILLDDYITEVKEMIRAELSSSESSRILDSVRKRMDEDVHQLSSSSTGRTSSDSCHSLSPCTSYVTARECSSSCCCCCCDFCDCKYGGACESSCQRCKPVVGSREKLLRKKAARYSEILANEENQGGGGAGSTSAISSQSVDSGVQLDFPRSSSGCISSSCDDARSLNEKAIASCCSETSINDEMLCRRVESAVRKFTEKLIVCERRARDRSRSPPRYSDYDDDSLQPANPRLKGCASLTDQRVVYKSSFNCTTTRVGANGWSEDESITGISTPSLVSLSDDEHRE